MIAHEVARRMYSNTLCFVTLCFVALALIPAAGSAHSTTVTLAMALPTAPSVLYAERRLHPRPALTPQLMLAQRVPGAYTMALVTPRMEVVDWGLHKLRLERCACGGVGVGGWGVGAGGWGWMHGSRALPPPPTGTLWCIQG